MEQDNKQEIKTEVKRPAFVSGVSYPVESIEEILNSAKLIVEAYGTSRPISKEEIAKILGRTTGTLTLFYSTLGQYGIFNLVHGKGHQPSDLYRKYLSPVHDNDDHLAKLKMFSSAPLYQKVIANLNGHTLPSDEKRLANLFREDPYNVSENSADRAAKVFIENCRQLSLRDNKGNFNFSLDTQNKPDRSKDDIVHPPPPPPPPPPLDDDMFELPIPLPNRRKAFLKYPIGDLTKRDIMVITKALDFIASSLDED